MTIHSYNIENYESVLISEIIKLTIIAVILSLLFVAIIVYSIIQIKNDSTKKLPYIQLVGSIALFVLLAISLGLQIISYAKDITEETYIQYEGPANIRTERQIVFGGIPTGYTEYIVSFEQDGELIELSMRKSCGLTGEIEKVYIVYSKHSKYIFEIVN
jgi:hypothetical protein